MPRREPVRAAAEQVLRFLAATDPAPAAPVDAIIGFGVFDLTLPRFCVQLFEQGLAPRIIFTGGLGAGTGNLGGPEADVWRAEVARTHPEVARQIITENRSTNTAENIEFTATLLEQQYPDLAFGRGITTAIAVASPSRLRRVRLSLRRRQPAVRVTLALPAVSLDVEQALYESHGVPYLEHLIGELDRLETYPARGWIAAEPIPPEILAAKRVLSEAVGTGSSKR